MSVWIKAGQNIWEKLKRTKVEEKSIFAILLIGLVIILIPMFLAAKYNVPCVDDYSYGLLTHLAWEQSHSFLNVLNEGLKQVSESYFGWQGSFSAVFMFSLQPAVFGEEWYPLTTYIMLISLCGGIVYLFIVVFRQILNATWYQAGIVITLLLAICTQLLPSPNQAFYWYNGSVYYTFFFGVSLVLYAKVLTYIRLLLTGLSRAQRIFRLLSISILSAIIGGANYVTALTTAILFTFLLVILLVQKMYSYLCLIFPYSVFGVTFIVNILAPGNSVRQSAFQYRPSVFSAVYFSFRAATKYAQSWLTPSLVLLVIFLIPLLYKIAAKTKFSYSYPALILFGSFCLLASMFCPPIYAMGTPGQDRLINIIYYAFVILLIFNLFYVLGWCKGVVERRGMCLRGEAQEREWPVYSVAYLLVVFVLFLLGSILAESTYTSRNALGVLVRGEANEYYNIAKERLALLNDDSQQDVVLPVYPAKPWILYFDDITADPADWRNITMSNYYEKNSVVLEAEE